jgi:hypothetical protein
MRQIFAFPLLLRASAIAMFLAGGCSGRSENERCQVNSDCASGLTCDQGVSGNGLCTPSNAVVPTTDAALKSDVPVVGGPEVETIVDAEVKVDQPAVTVTAVDADTLDTQ